MTNINKAIRDLPAVPVADLNNKFGLPPEVQAA